MLPRFLVPAFFFVCLLTGTSGCGPQKSPNELPKEFQGTWDVVDSQGKKIKNAQVVFENDTFDLTRMGKTVEEAKANPSLKTNFNVDQSKTPSEINFVLIEGDNMGKTRLGIYALEGDKLKIAIAELNVARPTDFVEEKEKTMVLLLERRPPESAAGK